MPVVSSPELTDHIRKIRMNAGRPAERKIAAAVHFSGTTVNAVLNGQSGNWVVIKRMLVYFGASKQEISDARRMWTQANTDERTPRTHAEAIPVWSKMLMERFDTMIGILDRIEKSLVSKQEVKSL